MLYSAIGQRNTRNSDTWRSSPFQNALVDLLATSRLAWRQASAYAALAGTWFGDSTASSMGSLKQFERRCNMRAAFNECRMVVRLTKQAVDEEPEGPPGTPEPPALYDEFFFTGLMHWNPHRPTLRECSYSKVNGSGCLELRCQDKYTTCWQLCSSLKPHLEGDGDCTARCY